MPRQSSHHTGRGKLWLVAVAALLPIAVLSSPSVAIAAPVDAAFSPPTKMLSLTRTLHRQLPGGKEVLTRRRYEVRITRQGDGYRVDGKQISVTVEAPPMLQQLAAIEQSRVDQGMFPILLDASGAITSFANNGDTTSREQAANLVGGLLNKSQLPDGDKAQAQGFVGQVQNSPAAANDWPLDLFNSRPGKRSESRRIALPDGGEGTVTISIESRQSGADRHESTVERIVVTDLGGTQRTTREEWAFALMDR
jgi:hypothetical protein